MDGSRPSATAMAVAVSRDAHREFDERPLILDDPYALMFVGGALREIRASHDATFSDPIRRQIRSSIVARARYAEDRMLGGSFGQYIILGAGLDSFAWRRPELVGRIKVIEVDHPATQEWKRSRAAELGLPIRSGHIFVPVDFEIEPLEGGLNRALLDWSQPIFFSCLGVTMYLTIEAVDASLRTVAACAPGSEVVLSYDADESFLDDMARKMVDEETKLVAEAHEPYTLKFSPSEIEELVTRCGLEVVEHLSPDDLYDRYFSHRRDNLRPSTAEHLIAARAGSSL